MSGLSPATRKNVQTDLCVVNVHGQCSCLLHSSKLQKQLQQAFNVLAVDCNLCESGDREGSLIRKRLPLSH